MFVLDEMDNEGRDAVRGKVQQMQGRLKELNAEIHRRTTDRQQIDNADEIADAVCGKLSDLAVQVPNLPSTALRNLLQVFLNKLVVDLETKNVEVTFALPEWATVDTERLCLVGHSVYKTTNEAHPVYVLATYRGTWQNKTYRIKQIRSRKNVA